MSSEVLQNRQAENPEGQLEKRLRDTLEKIRETKLFDPEYLKTILVVVFGVYSNEAKGVFRNALPVSDVNEKFDAHDFMLGKRTDFVGINSPEEFEKLEPSALSGRQLLPFLFLSRMPLFEEFVAHEMAHNVFDRLYREKYGEYIAHPSGITEVSDAYSKNIKEQLLDVWDNRYPLKEYPSFNREHVKKLDFSRQQIAEIFAQLYQREFCRRSGINMKVHDEVQERVEAFIRDPASKIQALNESNKRKDGNERKVTLEDFFVENHTLSLIMAPVLEEKYPDFSERIEKIFGFPF